jgi:hypothetical protein
MLKDSGILKRGRWSKYQNQITYYSKRTERLPFAYRRLDKRFIIFYHFHQP